MNDKARLLITTALTSCLCADVVAQNTDFMLVSAADVRYQVVAQGDQRSNPASLQCMGDTIPVNQMIYSLTGSNGATGREKKYGLGRDPDDASKWAFYFSVRDSDPNTAGVGNKRCEHVFGRYSMALPWDQDFWFATSVRTSDWRNTRDEQLIWQMHDSGQTSGLSPFLAAVIQGDTLDIQLRHNYSATVSRATTSALHIYVGKWDANVWNRFVVKSRISQGDPYAGFVQIWLNGLKVADYHGPFGYRQTEADDYVKVGYYHWSDGNPWDMAVPKRELWMTGVAMFLDRPGYTWESADALLPR
jgi:hypothetical protein